MDSDQEEINVVEIKDYTSDYDEEKVAKEKVAKEKDAEEEHLELVVDQATGKAKYRKRLSGASK